MTVDGEMQTVAYLQWSVLRAMLNEVTPDLRGVSVRFADNSGTCRFFYEGPVTNEIWERVDDIEAEVVSDYVGDTAIQCVAEHLPIDQPRELGPDEYWAYLRHEAST